jgi:cytochrome c-type biogenesis protein CcmF
MTSTARRLVLAAAPLTLAAVSPAAAQPRAHDHDQGQAVSTETAELPAQTASVARRLWNDLVCLCGECQRLTLAACPCPEARKERDKVLELLSGRDLSTPSASEAAYQAIVTAYIQRFGGRHVLAAENASPSTDSSGWIVLVSLLAVSGLVFIFLERRRSRGGRRRRRR